MKDLKALRWDANPEDEKRELTEEQRARVDELGKGVYELLNTDEGCVEAMEALRLNVSVATEKSTGNPVLLIFGPESYTFEEENGPPVIFGPPVLRVKTVEELRQALLFALYVIKASGSQLLMELFGWCDGDCESCGGEDFEDGDENPKVH